MNPVCFTFLLMAVLLGPAMGVLRGEVVEEETWYDASGAVVKTVTRTYTGADAGRYSSWEPAWVARERGQVQRLRGGAVRFRGGSSYCPSYRWSRGCYPVPYRYHRPYPCRTPYRSGFFFAYRGGNWAAGYRSAGGSACRVIGR